jgi:hypothetical protein
MGIICKKETSEKRKKQKDLTLTGLLMEGVHAVSNLSVELTGRSHLTSMRSMSSSL